jgi:hypothetical protein
MRSSFCHRVVVRVTGPSNLVGLRSALPKDNRSEVITVLPILGSRRDFVVTTVGESDEEGTVGTCVRVGDGNALVGTGFDDAASELIEIRTLRCG